MENIETQKEISKSNPKSLGAIKILLADHKLVSDLFKE
jgi:hypothetical protein